MDEKKIQHEYVMEFLCRREEEGGLGYRKAANSIVSPDLFIPSLLGEFVQKAVPDTWNRLLRHFDGDQRKLEETLKNAVKEYFLKNQNVAIMFNQYKQISFCGETVPLFYVSGSELTGDEDFKKNIFAVVEEASHTISTSDKKKLKAVRPDITFFLNGIYIGYMELKSILMGQDAKNDGRGKIVKDYLETIAAFADYEKNYPQIFSERRDLFSIFEKGIHLTTSDLQNTYVMRGIARYYDMGYKSFSKTVPDTIDIVAPELIKVFKEYPVSSPNLNEHERFEEVMRALYSKKMIEKEIRYYNVIEYHYAKGKDGKYRTSNTGQLISPRPKQKFGCDKILGRVKEMLDHEKDPDYYRNKLRKELQDLGLTTAEIEKFVQLREHYCNNKYVYSLLMQYAAGFGKSNIIGWTALQLKDYRYEGKYAYDKILLVVDRLQLRGQLDTMMRNMNIDKSMFKEAVDKPTFIKALEANERIIVVNIQKFFDLQEAMGSTADKLKKMRVAFLIDEIHRSNSGEDHEKMIDLFDQLQTSFNQSGEVTFKKNLIIGFTATPNEENLTRFGEFRSASHIPFWVPFDTYTMKEAISDGYILDPTEHIIPYAVPVGFEKPGDLDIDEMEDTDIVKVRKSKEKVYSFEPRMRKIAEFVVERLVSLVYGKIAGQGKAMLAVSSIPNAIKYFNIIRPMYAEKCKDPLFERFKDAPIIIIYSDNQKHQSCTLLNGGVNEETAIQNFKQAKNGLIIVVDKLQTGFDEPKLHTLFLDKEISDINAIQTISRVNRTCKGKEECHVIDCSWNNVNIENINKAFRMYCNMVTSHFNPEQAAKDVANQYVELCKATLSIQWFSQYKKQSEDTQFIITMEDAFRKWIEQCFEEETVKIKYNVDHGLKEGDVTFDPPINNARDLRLLIGQYANGIMDLKNVFVLDKKYMDELFLEFWHIYCRIYAKTAPKNTEEVHVLEVVDSTEVPGITLVEDTSDAEEENPSSRDKTPWVKKITILQESKGKTVSEILEILHQLNEAEKLTAEQAQIWLREIGVIFTKFKEDSTLCATLTDEVFSIEEKRKAFTSALRKYRNKELKNRPDIVNLERFKQLLKDNEEQLFAMFLAQIKDVNNGNSDFDFDTTNGASSSSATGNDQQPTLSWEDFWKEKMKKMFPDYDESSIKQIIDQEHSNRFNNMRDMKAVDEVVDNLFMVLTTETTNNLDGINTKIKNDLNMLLRAEEPKHDVWVKYLNDLTICFEGYLKKLYFMTHGFEYIGQDPSRDVTLMEIFKAFHSLKKLRDREGPEYKRLSDEWEILKLYRNKVAAHASVSSEGLDLRMVLKSTIDMYLYATGTSIEDMERRGYYPNS